MRPLFFRFAFIFLVILGLGFASSSDTPDLSTPRNSYDSFVNALKASNTDLLQRVATPTGMTSLMVLAEQGDFNSGLNRLGDELEGSELEFSEITEDIYFVSARLKSHTHKMEFTLEEPGWMLYHWQIGGGADH